jgi:hypothetical protein
MYRNQTERPIGKIISIGDLWWVVGAKNHQNVGVEGRIIPTSLYKWKSRKS